MIRIGVISDTHGSFAAVEACVGLASDVDGWFHLGDYASDAKKLRELTGKPVYSVLGNCDGWGFGGEAEDVFPAPQRDSASERVVTVGGVRILLCHGHMYDVDLGPYTLSYRAEEKHCAAALYGHTHRGGLSAYGSLLMLNPGSPSRPRGSAKRSFAVLEIDNSGVNAKIVTL
ncbi:MAG: metallophosphoesterase [Clostridia bacterium]|nr:metallophosphoesterase [Clostridia bacterium]